VGSKTLHKQNPPVLNCGCWLTQVVLYIGRKTVVVIVRTLIFILSFWSFITLSLYFISGTEQAIYVQFSLATPVQLVFFSVLTLLYDGLELEGRLTELFSYVVLCSIM